MAYFSNEDAALAQARALQDRAWNINKQYQDFKQIEQPPVITIGEGLKGKLTETTPFGSQLFSLSNNSSDDDEDKPTTGSSSENATINNNAFNAYSMLLPLVGIGGLAALFK